MNRWFSIFYARRLRDRKYLLRVGMVFGYLVLLTLILPKSYQTEFNYEVGETWDEPDLYAPFDFAIHKTQDSIEAEQAMAQVFEIYVPDSARIYASRQGVRLSATNFAGLARRYQTALSESREEDLLRLNQQLFSGNYGEVRPEMLPKVDEAWTYRFTAYALRLLDSLYAKGYIYPTHADTIAPFIALRPHAAREQVIAVSKLITSRSGLQNWLKQQLSNRAEVEKVVLYQILLAEASPSYVFSPKLTQQEKNRVRSLVSPVWGKVYGRQRIIQRGERVDKETYAIIRSLSIEKEARYGKSNRWNVYISQFLTLSLLTFMLLIYLSVNRPRIFFSLNQIGLILTIMLLAVGAMSLAVKLTDIAARVTDTLGNGIFLSYIYLAPVCIVPIFITNFFGHRTGFLCNLLVALYGAILVERGMEFAFVQLFAGTIAVYSLHRLRKREVFFYTLGYIFLSYALAYVVFGFYTKGDLVSINYGNLLLFGINVALTVIVYNLIYLFERIFGLTSDLTYLELLDTNHPLLQALARKAPGTFQHSLQVANIAEATINVVGGNALLIHVGALYHDIGKMTNQRYFIENMPEETSPHDQLTCEQSASLIIGHVALGVEYAHKYKLPKEIIDFIETHHGTTRVEYFYRKHLKEINCKPPHDEKQFRYPGPKPFSKETAVLMIADSVEAASRSLVKPTAKDLTKLVDNIIDHKIKDEQLENSNLTFKDLAVIRKVVTKQLLSIYHGRIEYPKEEEPAEQQTG